MWWRNRREADLDRELRDHVDLETERTQDRHAAQRALGNAALIKESVREAWGWTRLERLQQDLRYAVRGLRKSPAFALTAALSLALGIGGNAAIFTIVNSVLLKPLPFPEPGRLVQLWETKPVDDIHRNVVNGLNFLDWRERTHSFEDVAAVTSENSVSLTGLGDPIPIQRVAVSPQYFSVLGVAPILGRSFTAEEGQPGKNNVAVLSFGLWQSRFGGDPSVLGRRIVLSGSANTVVGVMPRGFALPRSTPDVWLPLPVFRSPIWAAGRNLTVIARLKPGIALRQADQDVKSVAAQSARERPAFTGAWSAEAAPMLADATREVRLPLLVLFAAVGLVLLIACANVANLLLMRANGRAREMAVRAALGAAKARLLQQLLAESMVLALLACGVGLGFAYWGLKALLAMIPDNSRLPRMDAIHLDGSVFLFAVGLAVLTAALFGLVPAFQVSQTDPNHALRQGATRNSANNALRRALVAGEIALALILLVGAGLMLRSFNKLVSLDPGFDTQHLLTLEVVASPGKYLEPHKRSGYFARLLEQIRTVPGVQAAGSVHFLPLEERVSGSCWARADEGPPNPSTSAGAEFLVVSPGYFEAMGTPLRRGRYFELRDGVDSPSVIVVNQQFVNKFFKDRDPLGQKLNVCWGAQFQNPAEIVGVAGDARQEDLQTPPQPTIFVDNFQSPMFPLEVVVRAAGDPLRIVKSVEAAIHGVDPDQALTHVESMEQIVSASVAQPRVQLVLLAIFGCLAGLLAIIGIYGIVAYSAAQRRREIGIRMALGALPADVRRLVLKEGLTVAAIGVGIGVGGALALTRFLRSLLFETEPADPVTLSAAAVAVLVVVVLATLMPANRASRISPAATLRCE